MQTGKFTEFATSEKAIVAGSAMLFTPSILAIVDQVAARVNFPITNVTIVLLVAAVVVFVIAGFFSSGLIQNVLLGLSIGLLVNALLTVPQVGGVVNRISSSRTRSG